MEENKDIEELLNVVEERYKHLKVQYGEHDPYAIGFYNCMNIIKIFKRMKNNDKN